MRRWKSTSSKIYQGFDYTWNGAPMHAGPTKLGWIVESTMPDESPMVTVLENPGGPGETELDITLSDLKTASVNPSGSIRLRAYYHDILHAAKRLMKQTTFDAKKPSRRRKDT